MKIVERMIQDIFPGQNSALDDIDKRYDAIEVTLGFPPKKRLFCLSGPHSNMSLVIEREWESLAAMEAAYDKAFAHPEIQALWGEGSTIIKGSRTELYTPA